MGLVAEDSTTVALTSPTRADSAADSAAEGSAGSTVAVAIKRELDCVQKTLRASAAGFDVWKGNTSMESTLISGFADWLGETRVFGEFLSFAIYGLLHRTLPNSRSHGTGVLLIPGFLSGDLSLSPLADRLRQIGYTVFCSGIWYNVDCPVHTMPRLEKVLRRAHHETGSKVVLIGHSTWAVSTHVNWPVAFPIWLSG
jgi:hypothetical protein